MRNFHLKDFFLKKAAIRKGSLLSASAEGLLLAGTAEGQAGQADVSIV